MNEQAPDFELPDVDSAVFGLAIDLVTADVVSAFDEAGIDCILLRGPALANTLYDGLAREYGDIDLLVSPSDHSRAEEVLTEVGFGPVPDVVHFRRDHASPWERKDGMAVDLHMSLVGIGASPRETWEAISAETESIFVGGTTVSIPGVAFRAFQVALHAAQHGARIQKPLDDLERGLERTAYPEWQAAAELAARLDAMAAFSTGLRLLPAGSTLADRLDLPESATPEVLLRATTPEPMSRGFARLASTDGAGPKAKLVARELFPEPEFMRRSSTLASGGTLGLAAAYVWRVPWLLWHVVPGLRAWRAAKKAARQPQNH